MPREKSMRKAEKLWPLLVKKAKNRKKITYAEVMDYLEYTTCQPVNHVLWNITDYCDTHRLPPLTAIVISGRTGTCGKGFTNVKGTDVESMQKQVFAFTWDNVKPIAYQ